MLSLITADQKTVADSQQFLDNPNLTTQEEHALQELTSTVITSIVIKPADKGSASVLMDRTDYVLEAQQLSDTTYYVPLQRAISPETADLVSDILERLRERGFLSKRQVT